jgi:feruloyl-CoA synthase
MQLKSDTDPTPGTRPVRLDHPRYDLTHQTDGTILLRAQASLAPFPERMTDKLIYWAQHRPEQPLFVAQEAPDTWRAISYSTALQIARSIATALRQRDLSAERPVVILSGNDLDHAMLALGCMYAGIPYAPISPAYSLVSDDFERLKQIMSLLTPGLIFASDGLAFTRALRHAAPGNAEIVVSHNAPSGMRCSRYEELAATTASATIDADHSTLTGDTIVKFLFTSGSTGEPKAVINTNRMWCSNQEMLRTALAYVQDEPPTIVDWAPWHHTGGGNHNLGLALYNGGTFFVDSGKPLPGAFDQTVALLRRVAPTWYFNVPKGFEALLPHLRSDEALRRTFFSQMKVLWFAGAGIAQHIFDEVQQLALDTCGERILFLTGFGSTETAPYALARLWHSDIATNVGLPAIGMDLKLVPTDDRLEGRVRGPNITPGYWRRPRLTAEVFDTEGFYRLGDAFRFEDPENIAKGLLFDGRVAENFKLASGTWVHVGELRNRFIAHFAPLVRDVVLIGADRDFIAAMICLDTAASRDVIDGASSLTDAGVAAEPALQTMLRKRLSSFAKQSTGGSTLVRRAIVMIDPPTLDSGEMTDKGSINQRSVLRRRSTLVEQLYASCPDAGVMDVLSTNATR